MVARVLSMVMMMRRSDFSFAATASHLRWQEEQLVQIGVVFSSSFGGRRGRPQRHG